MELNKILFFIENMSNIKHKINLQCISATNMLFGQTISIVYKPFQLQL